MDDIDDEQTDLEDVDEVLVAVVDDAFNDTIANKSVDPKDNDKLESGKCHKSNGNKGKNTKQLIDIEDTIEHVIDDEYAHALT